ncbi:hypothetical protein C1Y63_10430 [Corynebacterium sp. 13CS0277]|uniref:hypothetical protein n=1 Tax=Corynebacterium sp. 13CS0277 TaxID=2071994 RepID=UPI000D0448D8|nr:hypothetical protein [Corynebacterium sp. 13CS0277]PRQ10603.1 hypothetical protein C1Y63_10430 [Corynebacterium sp. 13CS0277]
MHELDTIARHLGLVDDTPPHPNMTFWDWCDRWAYALIATAGLCAYVGGVLAVGGVAAKVFGV